MISLLSRKRSTNDAPTNSQTKRFRRPNKHDTHQHATALTVLSPLHVSATTSAALSSRRRLADARSEDDECQARLAQALEWKSAVESRWGVVPVDSTNSSDDGSDADLPIVKSVSCESSDDDNDIIVDDGVRIEHEDAMDKLVTHRTIRVMDSGEEIVNGLYCEQCLVSNDDNNSNKTYIETRTTIPTSIYINENGPFIIDNVHYEVCLFSKGGYGDKFRWCLGLVPIINTTCTTIGNGCADGTDIRRRLDLERAYIYYWMEIRLSIKDNSSSSSNSLDDETMYCKEWNACHGVRPVPVLKEIKADDGGCWWWSNWMSMFW